MHLQFRYIKNISMNYILKIECIENNKKQFYRNTISKTEFGVERNIYILLVHSFKL